MPVNGNNHTPEHKTSRAYRALTRNMVLFVVLAALIPLLITGAFTLHQFSQAYQDKLRDHLRELVQKQSQNIDTFLSDRLGDIRFLARTSPLFKLEQEAYLRSNLQALRDEFGGAFVDLGLVNPAGVQVAYAGPFHLTGADYGKTSWFTKAKDRNHYVSDVFTGLRGTPHFIVAAKKPGNNGINQGDQAPDYLLRATIDFEAFNALVERLAVGKTGFAFIINRAGQYQTKPRFGVNLKSGVYAQVLAGKIDPRQAQVLERPDEHGDDTLYAMALLKGGDWILCLQQRTSDALAGMYTTVGVAFGLILFTAIIIVVLAFPLSRRLVSRLERADLERRAMSEKVIETGRMASIGELAAGIAHEINNPVAIMVEEAGWIEDILGEDKPVDEEDLGEIQRAVQQIRIQGNRCKDITYKLLSFARKTDPTPHEVQLNDLVEEVIGLLSQKSRFASVRVDSDLSPDTPPVMASASELQQVVLNLMNNAVDAMGKSGGVMRLSTRGLGGKAVLSIADTGDGIPEQFLPRIFDPFFTTKPVGQGTGLGLSICYGIVDKLGGRITVQSEVGRGTTFNISLPAVEGQGSHTKQDGPAENSAGLPRDKSNSQEEIK